MFVAIARSHPESDLVAAESKAKVRAALKIVLHEMDPADSEILERHALGGEPLGTLFATVEGWSGKGSPRCQDSCRLWLISSGA